MVFILRKLFVNFFLPLLLALVFTVTPLLGKYGGGSGTEEDPYLIASAEQFNDIGKLENYADMNRFLKRGRS